MLVRRKRALFMTSVSKHKKAFIEAIANTDQESFLSLLRELDNLTEDVSGLFPLLKASSTVFAIRSGLAMASQEPQLINLKTWQTYMATFMVQDQSQVFRAWVQLSQKEKHLIRDFLSLLPNTPKLQPWIGLTSTLPPQQQPQKARPPKGCDNLVYIVDDSRIIQSMLGRLIKSYGVKHKSFLEPREVGEALQVERPCLIFTDLNMPGLDGLTLTKDIRQSWRSEELPIVLVTAPEEVPNEAEVRQIGIDRVIPKPFDKALVGDVLVQFGLIEEVPG